MLSVNPKDKDTEKLQLQIQCTRNTHSRAQQGSGNQHVGKGANRSTQDGDILHRTLGHVDCKNTADHEQTQALAPVQSYPLQHLSCKEFELLGCEKRCEGERRVAAHGALDVLLSDGPQHQLSTFGIQTVTEPVNEELQGRQELVARKLLRRPWKLEHLKRRTHGGFEAMRLVQQPIHVLTDIMPQVRNLRVRW